MPTRTPLTVVLLLLGACGGDGREVPAAAGETAEAAERPETSTDTLMIEGMPETITLRLFRTPEDFPLPFSAYVPEDMAPESGPGEAGEGSTARFVAEFGQVRNDRAFVHLFVHPEGTPPREALAMVRAYEAATGIPVSRGIEPLEPEERTRRMPWADHGDAFRYQAGGTWYVGSIGLGSRDGRLFHLVTHYPAEYGDGFGPRAALILGSWLWADGTPLQPATGASAVSTPGAKQ